MDALFWRTRIVCSSSAKTIRTHTIYLHTTPITFNYYFANGSFTIKCTLGSSLFCSGCSMLSVHIYSHNTLVLPTRHYLQNGIWYVYIYSVVTGCQNDAENNQFSHVMLYHWKSTIFHKIISNKYMHWFINYEYHNYSMLRYILNAF